VERRAAHVVLDVGVGAGLQQALGGVGAGVAGGQVQRRLAGAVRLVVQVGALVDEVGDDLGRRVLHLLLAVARLQAAAAAGGDHQRGEAILVEKERQRERERERDVYPLVSNPLYSIYSIYCIYIHIYSYNSYNIISFKHKLY